VNSGHKVVALADDGQASGLLKPGLLKVAVENSFTLAVEETSGNNESLNALFFEVQHQFLSLTDASVLLRRATHLVILLIEGNVEHFLFQTL